MKASAGEAPRSNEGWDETVLVWNAKVSRILPPGTGPGRAGKRTLSRGTGIALKPVRTRRAAQPPAYVASRS
jgi:hypothetical protein